MQPKAACSFGIRTVNFLLLFFAAAILFIAIFCRQADAEIRFVREKLSIHLSKSEALVDGTYIFYNSAPEKDSILISYPIWGHFPYQIEVTHKVKNQLHKIKFKKNWEQKSIVFPVTVCGNGEKKVAISFKQQLSYHFFQYILTSTSAWNSSLEETIIEVIVPNDFVKMLFSYTPDECLTRGEMTIYKRIISKLVGDMREMSNHIKQNGHPVTPKGIWFSCETKPLPKEACDVRAQYSTLFPLSSNQN